jgi:hypothetical protein
MCGGHPRARLAPGPGDRVDADRGRSRASPDGESLTGHPISDRTAALGVRSSGARAAAALPAGSCFRESCAFSDSRALADSGRPGQAAPGRQERRRGWVGVRVHGRRVHGEAGGERLVR